MIPFSASCAADSSLILMTQSCTHGRPRARVNSRPCHVAASGVMICLQARVSLGCDPVKAGPCWAGSECGQEASKDRLPQSPRQAVMLLGRRWYCVLCQGTPCHPHAMLHCCWRPACLGASCCCFKHVNKTCPGTFL